METQENNIQRPRSIVVYANDVEAYYYSCIAVDWGDVTTFGHTLHKIPTDDLPILISESNPILMIENFDVKRQDILSLIKQDSTVNENSTFIS